VLYGNLRKHLGEVFRKLAEQKDCRIEEGHLLADHVHMMISIPPKYAVSQVVGFMKGKSAIHLARVYGERKQNYAGQSFWARGYFISTVGRDEATIREYIRNQEKEDQRIDQLNLALRSHLARRWRSFHPILSDEAGKDGAPGVMHAEEARGKEEKATEVWVERCGRYR
jgi:putative transposase